MESWKADFPVFGMVYVKRINFESILLPLEKEPESCRWHLPPFCALADLALKWNDIDEWFPEPRWGSDVPRNALGVPARRGWTATERGGHTPPPTGEAPFSGPHFQVKVLMGVCPIFVEACKATPPNVWLTYMLNHMDKENSVDLKYHECLAGWHNYRIVCDYGTKKHRFKKSFRFIRRFPILASLLSQTSPILGCFPIPSWHLRIPTYCRTL